MHDKANPSRELQTALTQQGCAYEVLQHEAYTSSDEATRFTGIQPEQAAKALLYKATGEYILAVLPASERVSSSRLRRALEVKRIDMASPQELMDVMGCPPGACHPIGRLAGIRTIVDPSLSSNETIGFSTGDPTRTITMAYEDYIQVADPHIAEIRQVD